MEYEINTVYIIFSKLNIKYYIKGDWKRLFSIS